MPSLRVYLFGVPRFERNGEAIHIPRHKGIALLAYLGLTGQAHSRDTLATMFWPEHDQSSARANLRRELSRINSALGFNPFDLHGEQVSLSREAGFWLDVAAFQAKLATAGGANPERIDEESMKALSQAVDLYSADFMAGFSLSDSPQFDDWQYFQSESLRRSLGEALQQLIRWKVADGELERAIEDARRWLTLDVLSEPAHRQLMQLYAWIGQHAAALRQYQECVRLLEKEIGVPPEAETTELYEAIRTRRLPPPGILVDRPEKTSAHSGEGSTQSATSGEGQLPRRAQLGNLPAPSTSFIGREKEQAHIQKLLVDDPGCRLLTVTGPGGAGKTRLALQAALASQPAFPDGAYFIPLVSLASGDHILFTLAEQLRFRFHEAAEHKRQLFDYLRDKKLLLLMDNFEHLVPGASLIVEILQVAPHIKVLVTSRERLNLSNEVVLALGGMQYPAWARGNSPDGDLKEYEAVKLFVESARRVHPDFELRPEDYEPVAHLCNLVEGMPLAIILAAGWLEMLSLPEISAEIARSLDFLESSAQDLPERQRSLRAVFDSSWSLLDDQERQALACLTVFQGGFTNQAALAVSGAPLKTLLALLQKAWLVRGQDSRLQIHELQRQYAFKILAAQPAAFQRARDAHGAYYAEKLGKLAEEMRQAKSVEAYDEVTREFENIRSAWGWLVERKAFGKLVHDLLPALYRYCEVRAKSSELLELVAAALQAMEGLAEVAADPIALTVLLTVQASFYQKGDPVRLDRYDVLLPPAFKENIDRVASLIQDFDSLIGMGLWGTLFAYLYGRFVDNQKGVQYLRQLIEHFRANDLRWELAYTHEMLGCLYLVVALYSTQKEIHLEQAGRNLSEALRLLQQLGDEREQGYTLLWIGDYHFRSGRLEEAKTCWGSAQAVFETGGDIISSIHWMVGNLLFTTGDYKAAFRYYHDIREQYLEGGHKRIAAYSLSIESIEALRYSDFQHARQTRQQSLTLSQEVGDAFGEAWSTWEMGEIFRVAGDPDEARLWFDRARGMFEDVKEGNGIIFYHRGLGDLAQARGDFEEAYRQFQRSLQLARQAEYEWGVTYALAGLGRAAIGLGQVEMAREHFVEALQTVTATRDRALALVVLAGWANIYAVTGEAEASAEICALVAGDFAAWNETKAQVSAVQGSLQGLSASRLKTAQKGGEGGDPWEFIQRLLVHSPSSSVDPKPEQRR